MTPGTESTGPSVPQAQVGAESVVAKQCSRAGGFGVWAILETGKKSLVNYCSFDPVTDQSHVIEMEQTRLYLSSSALSPLQTNSVRLQQIQQTRPWKSSDRGTHAFSAVNLGPWSVG